jgi:hypothetical protein
MMRRIRRCRSLRPWCRTCHDRMDYTMERMEKLIVICLLYITHQTAKKKRRESQFCCVKISLSVSFTAHLGAKKVLLNCCNNQRLAADLFVRNPDIGVPLPQFACLLMLLHEQQLKKGMKSYISQNNILEIKETCSTAVLYIEWLPCSSYDILHLLLSVEHQS